MRALFYYEWSAMGIFGPLPFFLLPLLPRVEKRATIRHQMGTAHTPSPRTLFCADYTRYCIFISKTSILKSSRYSVQYTRQTLLDSSWRFFHTCTQNTLPLHRVGMVSSIERSPRPYLVALTKVCTPIKFGLCMLCVRGNGSFLSRMDIPIDTKILCLVVSP